jgi:single-stranded-DNA-specific exonuclease
MIEKRWKILDKGEASKIANLAEVLNVDRVIAQLLIQRGIETFDEAKSFFRPSLDNLHDPFLMKDMDLAVRRIEEAIAKNEKILIYGDYDVDGTTAVALVYTFLNTFYHNIGYYVPDRYDEGYGISYKSIDYAAEHGFSLVIALDCGIKAVEKVAYAKDKNIDYIIADHHRPGDVLPDAVAVLDPKRDDCDYPYHDLSGCGVGFKLIQAYSRKNNIPFEQLHQYLDLVVVSIASDMVEVTGENRILAYHGLRLMNTNPRPGLEAILKYSDVVKKPIEERKEYNYFNKTLTINELVFLVGPRINAAGRMESAKNSVELLIAKTADEALNFAKSIDEFNTERKEIDTNITKKATEIIDKEAPKKDIKTTVVYNPDWHKGVIGIVASRLVEIFYRPTIVFTRSESTGLITGSARSVKDFDIYEAIASCKDILENFGGHKYAAGLSLKIDNLIEFKTRFEKYVSDHILEDQLSPEIEIDAVINLDEINSKFYRILKQFGPLGPGNMAPVFMSENLMDSGYARVVGKRHLKFSVVHPHIRTYPFNAIAFQQSQHYNLVKNNTFKICYYLEENHWNGKTTMQLNVKDIKSMEN